MKTTRVILTIILLSYFIPTILSGHDILKGTEPDLSTEWIIVFIYLILSFAYCFINLSGLLKDLKKN